MSAAKIIQIDVISDTVCPWCFIGKRRLEKAIKRYSEAASQPTEFRVKWHPYQLNPKASEEGVSKRQYYAAKFGSRTEGIVSTMTDTFASEGLRYNMDGLTGNTLASHRLIAHAGKQGLEKQNALVEALFKAYFTEGQYINDTSVLSKAAKAADIAQADEVLGNQSMLKEEVLNEIAEVAGSIGGVPFFMVNNRHQLSGAQDPSAFVEVFEKLSQD